MRGVREVREELPHGGGGDQGYQQSRVHPLRKMPLRLPHRGHLLRVRRIRRGEIPQPQAGIGLEDEKNMRRPLAFFAVILYNYLDPFLDNMAIDAVKKIM